jgi:hypothetical protein
MSILVKALRLMGTVWLWGAGLLIAASHLVVLHLDGFWALVNLLDPWNLANVLTLDLTAAPGLLLHMAADQLTATSSHNSSANIPFHPLSVDRPPAAAVTLLQMYKLSVDETPAT